MNKTTFTFTARIVSVFVANNTVRADQLPTLIQDVHRTLSTVGEAPAKAEPAVEVRKSIFPDHLVCLGCGGSFKTLKKHIMTEHQMMPEQYRAKFELPPMYLSCHLGIRWSHRHTPRCDRPYPRKSASGIGGHRRRLAGNGGNPADVRSICLLHAPLD